MKVRKHIVLMMVFILVVTFFPNLVKAQDINATFETDKRSHITTAKIKSNKKMNRVKLYKKAENGKFILFYCAKPGSESLECYLKSSFFSTESETDIKIVVIDDDGTTVLDSKVDKIPEMAPINPEETATPTSTASPIPTKPTPSVTSSGQPSVNPSGTVNPTGGGTEITGIKLNKNSVTLKVGDTDKLTYTVTPEGARSHLIWRTEAKDICSVAADGTITGISAGETNISIRTESGIKDTCKVTVVKEKQAAEATPSGQDNGQDSGQDNSRQNDNQDENQIETQSAGSVDELRNRLVKTAKKEVGNKNGLKYLKYFNTTKAPGGWCSEFASWCANECGYVKKGIIPKKDGCGEFSKWFKKKGRFKDRKYVPKPGDICFTGGNDVSHTCIVVGVDEEKGKFYTVDGGSSVTKHTRKLKGSEIYGFGVPDYESIAN